MEELLLVSGLAIGVAYIAMSGYQRILERGANQERIKIMTGLDDASIEAKIYIKQHERYNFEIVGDVNFSHLVLFKGKMLSFGTKEKCNLLVNAINEDRENPEEYGKIMINPPDKFMRNIVLKRQYNAL